MYHIAPTYNQYHAQSLPSPYVRLDMLYQDEAVPSHPWGSLDSRILCVVTVMV